MLAWFADDAMVLAWADEAAVLEAAEEKVAAGEDSTWEELGGADSEDWLPLLLLPLPLEPLEDPAPQVKSLGPGEEC